MITYLRMYAAAAIARKGAERSPLKSNTGRLFDSEFVAFSATQSIKTLNNLFDNIDEH